MKNLAIFGSTGSIGQNVLEVVRLNQEKFNIFALSCNKNTELLKNQCIEFSPKYAIVSDEKDAKSLNNFFKNKIDTQVLFEESAYKFIASHNSVTHVVAAITGSAGLRSTYEAAKAGKEILLANKESMVMAGSLILDEIKKNNGHLIPIDSEHNAIFQVINTSHTDESHLKKIILTASGGPFLNLPLDKIQNVTVSEALNHPNWEMGDKITIDSATMMNKGLEVIEAFYLFKIPKTKIDVIIHPQSIIHSMVEFNDGSILSQLGFSDMKIPISYALGYPERLISGLNGIDLTNVDKLTFLKPDLKKFPSLALAFDVLGKSQSFSIILNIANEVAVNAFLLKKIKFNQIYNLVHFMLEKGKEESVNNIEDVLSLSKKIEKYANENISKFY